MSKTNSRLSSSFALFCAALAFAAFVATGCSKVEKQAESGDGMMAEMEAVVEESADAAKDAAEDVKEAAEEVAEEAASQPTE